ncbi:ATP-binding protein [Streptomyces bobili]|uniref:ATP-binding protein n=1 Tax=Streptomyces bobili TaxID=67280 RepID=UPI0033B2003B
MTVLLTQHEAKAPSRLAIPVGDSAGEELMVGLAWEGEHVLISGGAGTGKTVIAGRVTAAARASGWPVTVLDALRETVPDALPGGILDVMQAIADGATGEPCVVVVDHTEVAAARELAALMSAPGVHVVLVTHPSTEAAPAQWIPDDPDAGWPMRLLRFGHRIWMGPGRAGLDVPRFLQVPETLGLMRRAAGSAAGSGVYASAGLGPTRFAPLPLG